MNTLFAASLAFLWCAGLPAQPAIFRLDSAAGLETLNAKAEPATYRGRRAVRLIDETRSGAVASLALLSASDFGDGTIEAEVAGAPRAGAVDSARGFIGIAFRVQPDRTHFECFYLRPTNGRAEDQLRRNHSVQYISSPGFPWEKLRGETPGVYESYADLETGAWTKVRIVVSGDHARLYVNGADQPTLLVNDLKLGKSRGKVALWIGPDTDGYFSNLSIRP